MKKSIALVFTLLSLNLFGQKNPTQEAKPIVDEGKLLYKSEMASWYGTDLFLEKYKDQQRIGGYFSYSEDSVEKNIFFSNSDNPKVIGTISFDSTYDVRTAKVDFSDRDFTTNEHDLYMIRKKALSEISSDTLFKLYKNTDFNLIPLIMGNEKKVYVLTGPKETGVVIFGNDYLLTFDKDNKLLLKKQLHKNIIPFYFGGEKEKEEHIVGAMHTHLPETGDFITATDICTLMLYEKFAKWKTYNVVSEKYLNIWNCETDRLTVVPMKVLDKINKDDEKRDRKKNKRK